MPSPSIQPDAVALVARLSVPELRQRLNDLDAEAKAVKVLLRAALARTRLLERRAPGHQRNQLRKDGENA
jgi:hypothetical protein